MSKTGVWIIGINGSVATTLVVGLMAIAEKKAPTAGITTESPAFGKLGLLAPGDIVFGGADIRKGDLYAAALAHYEREHFFDIDFLRSIEHDLARISEDVAPAVVLNCGDALKNLPVDNVLNGDRNLTELVTAIQADLAEFKAKHALERVVVVNLASTEPPHPALEKMGLGEFRKAVNNNEKDKLTSSALYAYAAIDAGCPYINFTPSAGSSSPALVALAEEKGVPHMGRDGKTGETLVKSHLASMFTMRNLDVLSWEGYNILGNTDGAVLHDPANKESKIVSKDSLLPNILGYRPHTKVGIDYVPSTGDRKVAWDFIHFGGFLGTKMIMQFIWQGCDSMLAAPLVFDLVRLADYAARTGQGGLMPHLACFFKDPAGVDEHSLGAQYRMLTEWVGRQGGS